MSAACMCYTYAFICGRVANYSWQLMILISPDFTCIRVLHFQIKCLMVCLVCLRVLHHHQPSAQSHLILQGSKITFSEVNYSEVGYFRLFVFYMR